MSATDPAPGLVALDGNKKVIECMSATKWATKMIPLTNAGWTKLTTGSVPGRNHILVRTLATAASVIIIAPAATGNTNTLTDSACGLPLEIGQAQEFNMTENMDLYATVVAGGAGVNAYISEAK